MYLKRSLDLSCFGVPCQTLDGQWDNFSPMNNQYETGNYFKKIKS